MSNESTKKEEVTEIKKVASLSALKPAANTEGEKEKKASKRTFSKDDYKKYLEILSDEKPHKIKDLLDTFSLDHTSAGRERLRAANRKINQSGTSKVDPVYVEGAGKHFQLVVNGKA
jgi:hypothetical protein